MDDRYKTCMNLVHVCPKFCPNSCYVDCQSCKPQCGTAPTLTPTVVPSPPPPTTTVTPSSPPPPIQTVTPLSPPPPTPTVTPSSPPPPTPTVTPSLPPPTVTPSPPPVQTVTPSSPPPPNAVTPPSPPPPTPTVTPSSPPPPTPTVTPSPPPIQTVTPSSPPPPTPVTPTVTSSPPPNPTDTDSPPPTTSTPSPPPPPSPPTSSNDGTPPTPPSDDSSTGNGVARARCKSKNFPLCYNEDHTCPTSCPYRCSVDCVTCKAVCPCDGPGAICQDPRFIGGDGITFYFHGKKDQDFCLVADSNLHINAHFIGKRRKYMKRDFTWVESIGILFGKHKLFVGAKKTASWDESVDRLALSFDGTPINLPENDGAIWVSETNPTTSVTRVGGNTNGVALEVEGKFRIIARVVPITKEESKVHSYGITEEDCFAHLDLSFKFHSLTNQVDGILGQTYRTGYVSRVKIGADMPIMGGDNKFVTSSLFKPDCNVAQFSGGNEDDSEFMWELPSLSCSSRMDGRGVVCRR